MQSDRPLRGKWVLTADTWESVADDKALASLTSPQRDAVVAALKRLEHATFNQEADAQAVLKDALAGSLERPSAALIAQLSDEDAIRPIQQIVDKVAEDESLRDEALTNEFDDFQRGKEAAVIGATLEV